MSEHRDRIRSHRDLVAWQKAIELVVRIYEISKTFTREEIYRLTSQMRRAAVSIPANIAEGQGRRVAGEYLHFLGIARGSLLELDTHLEIAKSPGFLEESCHYDLRMRLQEVGRLINGLMRSLTSNI